MPSREQKPPPGVNPPLAESSDQVAVGRIVGPWGIRGDLKVESLTDFPERFVAGASVYLGGVAYAIERCRRQRGRIVVKLAGIDSASAAEALRGRLLEVPEDDLRPLGEGQYYHFQVLGLEVRTTGGEVLGQVEQIISTGSNDVFVVRGRRGEILIPAVDDVVRSVDPAAGHIEVEAIEGLLPGTGHGKAPKSKRGR